MTLQRFLSVTSGLPLLIVRRAMAAALAVEPARTPEAYRRFYCRVLAALGRTAGTDCGPGSSQHAERAA